MRTLIFIAFLTFGSGMGWAADRVALVIGNSNYSVQPKLRNPVTDAVAIAEQLRGAGFKVTLGTDLTFDNMRRTINKFAVTLPQAKAALVFFAGHGVQVDGENYLIPIDADIQRTTDLTWQTVAVSTLVGELEAAGRTSIFILDACRNNPGLARRLRGLSTTTRALQVGTGLAQISAPDGSYVAFSTAPNTVALDGTGKHSPFAEALIKHLPTPGLDIALMMRRVRRDVRRTTKRQQTPWDSSSLTQPFYFFPGDAQEAKSKPRRSTGPTQFELSYWDSVKNSKNTRLIASYLEKYPKGHFADLADILIEELKRQWSNEVRQEVEEGKARRAELDGLKAKRDREAALKKAQAARRESAYKKALADAETARRAQRAAEAKLKQAQAKAQEAQQQAALARERRRVEIEKSEKDKVRVVSLPSAKTPEEGAQEDQRVIHKQLQEALQRIGCYRGRLDGLWGAASQRALVRAIGSARAKQESSEETLSLVRSSGKTCAAARQPKATAKPSNTRPRKSQRTTRQKIIKRRSKNVQNSGDCRDWRVCVSTRGFGDPTSDKTKRHCLFQPRGCVY